MIEKLNLLILTMLGLGNSKYAPGTVASFATCSIYIFFYNFQINIFFLIFGVFFIFIYSVYSLDRFKKSFDEIDSKEIVIDEFIGQSIPVMTIYFFLQKNDFENFILYTLFSFILFRFFDIIKPYPINLIDRNMKNGFGVMFDDVVAGLFTSVILLGIFSLINYE